MKQGKNLPQSVWREHGPADTLIWMSNFQNISIVLSHLVCGALLWAALVSQYGH